MLLNQRQYFLRTEAIKALGCIIFRNQLAQNKIEQLGGLTVLLETIGSPSFLAQKKSKQKLQDIRSLFSPLLIFPKQPIEDSLPRSIPSEVLQSEFVSQTVCWHVIRVATNINAKNLKKIEKSGDDKKVVNFDLSIFIIFSSSVTLFNSGIMDCSLLIYSFGSTEFLFLLDLSTRETTATQW